MRRAGATVPKATKLLVGREGFIGKIVNMDVGRVVVVSVLDYNGTPTNTDDDTLLSQSLVFQAGHLPDLDSNFELFCQNLVAYLT